MAGNRGPEDCSVLYLQPSHISNAVSAENIDNALRVKRTDNLIWGLCMENIIHHRVMRYLNKMGFYGILRCGYRVIDHHLITALVERWRRETHTFHFRSGEATITLQDISIIWGLKVDGEPVTGVDFSHTVEEWQHICLDLLGFEPSSSHFKGSHLSMTALDFHCRSRPVNNSSSEIDLIKYTRCIALMILGGIMFPDYQGGSVRLIFLQLLQNINAVNSYSWGSAVLAFLYRELCNATRIGKCTIAGPLYILQIWAWSRIQLVNPDLHGQTLVVPGDEESRILKVAPYGARWRTVFSHTHTPTHSVRIIRHCLDHMDHDQFNWIIYDKSAADVKKIIETYNNDIWRSVCPLIFFEIVEMHRPNRVMRQFKMKQSILPPAVEGDDLHNVTRIGRRNANWETIHKDAVAMWNRRLRFVAPGQRYGRSSPVDDDYMEWYERITIRIISPTVYGIGFHPHTHPYPSDTGAAWQQHHELNFSTPSSDSHDSSFRFDTQPSVGVDTAGPSGWNDTTGTSAGFDHVGSSAEYGTGRPSGVFDHGGASGQYDAVGSFGGSYGEYNVSGLSHGVDTTWLSSLFDTAGPSGVFDMAGPSSGFYNTGSSAALTQLNNAVVDQSYQTPSYTNVQSFTDSLNYDFQNVDNMQRPGRNVSSPIPFPSCSDEQPEEENEQDDVPLSVRVATRRNIEPRRGQRLKLPRDCGTGGHL